MEIEDVKASTVSVPLDSAVATSSNDISRRDFLIVYVSTADSRGMGYTLGYEGAKAMEAVVDDVLASLLTGEDVHGVEELWQRMFDETVQIGRKGLVLRAISAVDIALWDLKAKDAELPLYKYLGGTDSCVPVYASGGHNRGEDDLALLEEEVRLWADNGHDAIKVKVGADTVEADCQRLELVRDIVGEDVTLMLDANGAWDTKMDALQYCRRFADFDPYFIEEPAMPYRVSLLATLNDVLDIPVASGELEGSKHGFFRLFTNGAVDVAQPDVNVVGGVTEWLKVAHTADCFDIPVSPHYSWTLHAHLVSASPNGKWVEYLYPESNVETWAEITEDPQRPTCDGYIELPDANGHGISFDQDALNEYRV